MQNDVEMGHLKVKNKVLKNITHFSTSWKCSLLFYGDVHKFEEIKTKGVKEILWYVHIYKNWEWLEDKQRA